MCNHDCFNCKYTDCICDDMTIKEYQEIGERNKVLSDNPVNVKRREYLKKNPELVRKMHKKYYESHKEEENRKSREYYQKHKEELNAKSKIRMREYRAKKKLEKGVI